MPSWGSNTPQPLSRTKVELVWGGKYDGHGNRLPVRLSASPPPLQRIEMTDRCASIYIIWCAYTAAAAARDFAERLYKACIKNDAAHPLMIAAGPT